MVGAGPASAGGRSTPPPLPPLPYLARSYRRRAFVTPRSSATRTLRSGYEAPPLVEVCSALVPLLLCWNDCPVCQACQLWRGGGACLGVKDLPTLDTSLFSFQHSHDNI